MFVAHAGMAQDEAETAKGPKAPAAPFRDTVRLVKVLKPEVVQAYPACEELADKPDSIAVAFRDADGKTQLISSNYNNRRFVGDDLDGVKIDCGLIYKSGADEDYSHHDYHSWMHGVYTEDGQTVYALVHNEYWGHKMHPEECKNYNSCWANSITWVKSVDGGKTYQLPPVEERLVAALGKDYKVNAGKPYGFINPSNILREGGYLYSVIHSWNLGKQKAGSYLIRKPVDAAWNDWQIWSGEKQGFKSLRKLMAKGGEVGTPLPLGKPELPINIYTIAKHEPSGLFVALFPATHRSDRFPENDGYYIATSADLIHWSAPIQVVQANYMARFLKQLYPQTYYHLGGLLDPTSQSRTYGTIGNHPYIYATRITSRKPGTPALMELVRIPLDLSDILPQSPTP